MLFRSGVDFGFVPVVITGSTILYVLSLMASGSQVGVMGGGLFNILSPSGRALLLFGASGAIPVFAAGAWWTVLSATWLHGSLLHIVFNMMWVRDLGPSTCEIVGPARTVVIYTVSGVCGFLLSSLAGQYMDWVPLAPLRGANLTVGASASIFGLLGALMHYGRKSGSNLIHEHAKRYAILLFVFGLIGQGVDNYAHAGEIGRAHV